ncbi:N-6 DNA methylase [Sorangium sp. So ce1151]|uniref:N-6 DNA methylase n=1 Tax=Sorangium sp. So ce1151 TaxID=3133332 RepID=UPI003F623F95
MPSDFATWLADARKQKNLSQARLAEQAGVSQAQISHWETGKVTPSAGQIAKLHAVLGKPKARRPAPAAALELPFEKSAAQVPKKAPEKSSEPPPSPRRGTKGKASSAGSAAVLGFEEKLWEAADTLRGSMDPAEYKHVVLGLIFLKYISDAFELRYATLSAEKNGDPEDKDEYEAENVFWVPKAARWSEFQKTARQADIGVRIDKAMEAIEKENPSLKGTLPREYARPAVDKERLGKLIDTMSDIDLAAPGHNTKDLLGRAYEYFLKKFASAEGRLGGDFYTPQSVVRVLVEMLEPYKGRVFDPCCGSGGMFVQSEKFVEAHGGSARDISVHGQEWNATTWRLCRMNLAIRGIEANLGPTWANSFRQDLHPGLKADFVLANPPFNVSDWGGEMLREDARWKYGPPPVGNANFAWLQHILHHLSPERGVAGVVLANGSMSSQQSNEGEIRKAMIEADVVDCMVALPGQLFYATQIPVCLWFLARNKRDKRFRDRHGEVLFIDARKLGALVDRTHRELSDGPDGDIARIARTYHAWRGQQEAGRYADAPGFCKSATLEEIRAHGHVLTPGRYVGAEAAEDDDESFEEKMQRLTAKLKEQFAEGAKLEKAIQRSLRGLGYGQ